MSKRTSSRTKTPTRQALRAAKKKEEKEKGKLVDASASESTKGKDTLSSSARSSRSRPVKRGRTPSTKDSPRKRGRTSTKSGDEASASTALTSDIGVSSGEQTPADAPVVPSDDASPSVLVDVSHVVFPRYDDICGYDTLRKTAASKQNSANLLSWSVDDWTVLRAELRSLKTRLASVYESLPSTEQWNTPVGTKKSGRGKAATSSPTTSVNGDDDDKADDFTPVDGTQLRLRLPMPRQQPFDARAALAAERARVLAEQAARERAELAAAKAAEQAAKLTSQAAIEAARKASAEEKAASAATPKAAQSATHVLPLTNAAGKPMQPPQRDTSQQARLASLMRKRSAAQPSSRQQYLQGRSDIGTHGNATQPIAPTPTPQPLPTNITPATFWTAMESFFAPLTPQLIQSHLQSTSNPDERAFGVPPLGMQAESQAAAQALEAASRARRARDMQLQQRARQAGADAAAAQYWQTEAAQPGELTQQLLAALIELPAALDPAFSARGQVAAARAAAAARRAAEAQAQATSSYNANRADRAPAIPLAVPPTVDYSPQLAVDMDERVRAELVSVGLMDAQQSVVPLHERQDDELCAELRVLQRGLRERTAVNHKRKAQIAKLCEPAMREQQRQAASRMNDANMEAQLTSLLKVNKRRKKKAGGKRKRGGAAGQ